MTVEAQVQVAVPAITEEQFAIVQDVELAHVGGGGPGVVLF